MQDKIYCEDIVTCILIKKCKTQFNLFSIGIHLLTFDHDQGHGEFGDCPRNNGGRIHAIWVSSYTQSHAHSHICVKQNRQRA